MREGNIGRDTKGKSLIGINIPTLDEEAAFNLRLRVNNNRYTENELNLSQEWYFVRKRRAAENDNKDDERYERQWGNIDTLGHKLKAFLVDRTRTIDDFYAILGPLPTIPNEPVDYGAACDEKAHEILSHCRDEDKELRVSWSGGIDSTNAIVALLKFHEEYPEVDMKVCLNQKSIDEYPWFYTNLIESNDRIEIYRGEVMEAEDLGENEALGLNMSRDTGRDYVVVTGELGDQIFGAKILVPDIKENGTDGTVKMHYSNVFSPDMATYLEPLIDAMPDDWDRDCGHVMHWLNFILKWQWCQLRMFVMYPVPYLKYRHFFDHDPLQQWCLQNNMQVKWPEYDIKRYKEVAKRYIADFTGDEEYYIDKEKEDSQRTTINVFDSDPTVTEADIGKRKHWSAVDIHFNKEWKNNLDTNITITDNDEGFIVDIKTELDL
jgi:hypothetical protein